MSAPAPSSSSPSPDPSSSDPDSPSNSDSSSPPPSSSSSTPQTILQELFGSQCKQQLLDEIDKLKAAVQKDDPQAVIMSIPMLLALTICPAMLGTQEAIRQSQSKSKREEHRSRRCNLAVSCVKPSIRSRDINNKLVVLKDNKLYIANEHPLYNHDSKNNVSKGYPFSGYFLPYPDSTYEGLVTTISDDPPMLNWIYVDKKTCEVKYGVRADAQENLTGPFDCTKQDRRMTLQGWEGFCAVEELPGIWSLFYDMDDNGLKGKIPMGTRILEVELTRREKKEPKPEPDLEVPTTLEEKWKAHKAETKEADHDREAFLSTGAQPGTVPVPAEPAPAEPTSTDNATPTAQAPPAADPDTVKQKSEALSEAMRRLGLDVGLIPTTDAPSVVTNHSSTWSGARKANDGHSSGDSATAASSVSGRNNDNASVSNGSDDGVYKKPYVEDATAAAPAPPATTAI
ncbi:hypothetical protein AK830_g6778 [Neonectria ditissima]|uniref:Uncharacterized protein n=1 Tax=Neonectria ditissima TaxID=78410 RepID=A0A0N8H6S3_9HYPO|nr:hypothetical protein AK830_g6778 [Neonectria ditissima]